MGTQEEAVRREVRKLAPEDRKGALAALALHLAQQLDAGPPWREIAPIAAQLRAVLADLGGLVKPVQKADPLNDLEARRAARRGETG